MNEKTLITGKDMLTHKLSIKKPDGTYTCFYLSAKQAEFLAKSINGKNPFVVLPASITKSHTIYYPKSFSYLEILTREEKEVLQQKYINKDVDRKKEEAFKKSQEEKEQVELWVQENPNEFAKLLEQAEKEVQTMSLSSREKAKEIWVKSRARVLVRELFLSSH